MYKAFTKEYLENIAKGLLAGILSAYLIIYALRPAVPYPDLILEIFENKWMLLILLVINYYIYIWDYHSGAIFLLCIIALIFDYIVFTEKGLKKVVKHENFSNSIDVLIENMSMSRNTDDDGSRVTRSDTASKDEEKDVKIQEPTTIIHKILDVGKNKLDRMLGQ